MFEFWKVKITERKINSVRKNQGKKSKSKTTLEQIELKQSEEDSKIKEARNSESKDRRIEFLKDCSFSNFKNYMEDKNSVKRIKKYQNNQKCCVICLLEIPTKKAVIRDCKHEFCVDCLNEWTKITNKCPICKTEFFSINFFKGDNFIARKKIEAKKQVHEELKDSEDEIIANAEEVCYMCNSSENDNYLLICDKCLSKCCHTKCLDPPIDFVPQSEWFCDFCVKDFDLKGENPVANLFKKSKTTNARNAIRSGKRK